MNTQPIEKPRNDPGYILEVHSIFPTIQGEGPFTGRPAIFVRLAGCNLQCPWCDTDYTSVRDYMVLEQVVAEIKLLTNRKTGISATLVVITGGEPFRQNLGPISQRLIELGFEVQIETNGTLPPSAELAPEVMVVCSPKAGKVNKELSWRADCYKYVMAAGSVDPNDGLPTLALGHSAHPRVARPPEDRKNLPIYLQPMDSYDEEENKANIKAVVESCMSYGYVLQLQIHKIVGVE